MNEIRGPFTREEMFQELDKICADLLEGGADGFAPVEAEPPIQTFYQALADDLHPYGELARILKDAFIQSARGKGAERHAGPGQRWEHQPIITIAEQAGEGFVVGQAIKKLLESQGMAARGDIGAARREALGAIVYCAATVFAYEMKAEGPWD